MVGHNSDGAMTTPIILIAGISCSGKTTLADRLAFRLDCPKISIDDYYFGFDDLSLEAKRAINFDAAESVEHELLVQHLQELSSGKAINRPVYDHGSFARLPQPVEVTPGSAIVVEGLFALYWEDLCVLSDQRIFVETTPEVAFQRRLMRDTVVFGRKPQDVIDRHTQHVGPSQELYVIPSKSKSTMVVSGEEPLDGPVEEIAKLAQTAYLKR